jgi:hypothetical protein
VCKQYLTVLAPASLNWLSNYDQPSGSSFKSEIHYQILDNQTHVLPHALPWNEDIDGNGVYSDSTTVTTAAIPDSTGENWGWGEESGWDGSWVVDPNNAFDTIQRGAPPGRTPSPQNPQSPLGSAKICHSPTGAWYVGTTGHGGIGVKVKTLKWQVYQDHGRHE